MDYEKLKVKYDKSNMIACIDDFLEEFQKAFTIGYNFAPTKEFKNAQKVVGLGIGGSGMAYTILSNISRSFGTKTIEVISDYNLPPYVLKDTAVCVTSYSGNTEETLSAAEQARERGCPMVCISTGGKLIAWAKSHNIPFIQFSYVAPPRFALSYTLGVAYGLFCKAEFLKPGGPNIPQLVETSISAVLQEWPKDKIRAEAIKIVDKVDGKMIYMIGSGLSFPVAIRWKGQINENAKAIAFAEQMPEMCHNMYLGYKNPNSVLKNSAIIFLDSHLDHPQNRKRIQLVGRELESAGVTIVHPNFDKIAPPLGVLLAQMLLGDYVSYYLALKYEEDPAGMDRIEELKKKLA